MSAETVGLPRAVGQTARVWPLVCARKSYTCNDNTPGSAESHSTPEVLWQVAVASTTSAETQHHLPDFLFAPRMLLICGRGR